MTAPAVLAKKVNRTPNVSPTFRALVAYALDAEHHGAKLANGTHPEPTVIQLGAFSDSVEGLVAESEALAALRRGGGNNTMHVVISLESDRSLTDAEWKAAAETSLKNLNMEGHIALLAVHRNTENQHGHLIINRVCPEPDGRGRYLLRTDGGSVRSQGKDGRMRTNEVLSLHRAAAEIALGQGWPLSENGRFGPDLQLRPKTSKLRLSQGSATAQALGKNSPELRVALAAQAAIGKAREAAATGKPFWGEAHRELADAGITWKISEHLRKGQTVYGGKLTGEDGTNVKQSRLEEAYQIKALIAEYGPPPAENAPAKLSKEEALKASTPILSGSQDWAAIHDGLAGQGMSLERKGQGAIIKYNNGTDELKLSDTGRANSFGALQKRLGAFQENANAPEPPFRKEKPARLPKGTAIMELSESRAAALYREARNDPYPTAFLALRGLTPAQIVQVGKAGEKIEGERRAQVSARPTPTAKPIIKDHVLPRSLAEALDEIMIEMEQLARSQAAMRRIRAAVAAAEAAEAQARQMQAEAAKTLAWETKAKSNPQPENNDMFDFFKKKQEPAQPTEIPWQLYVAEKAREYADAIRDKNLGIAAQRLGEISAVFGGDGPFRLRFDADLSWCDESAYRASKLADTLEAAYAHAPDDGNPAEIAFGKFWRESREIFSSEPLPEWYRKLDAGEPLTKAEEQMHHHLIYRLNAGLRDGESIAQVNEWILSQQALAEKAGLPEPVVIDGVRVPRWVGKGEDELTPLERDERRAHDELADWASWRPREESGLALNEFEQGQKQEYRERMDAAAHALEARGITGIDLERHLYAASENILGVQLGDQQQRDLGLNVSLDLCSTPDDADPLDPMQDDPLDGPRL